MKNRVFLFSAMILLAMVSIISCKTAAREEKYYEKQEKKMLKQEQNAYDQKVKDHMALQSDETRKMMKETARQSRKINNFRKR